MSKVVIIGGGGRVGSNAAFTLQLGGVARELILIDANKDAAHGEATDVHRSAANPPTSVR